MHLLLVPTLACLCSCAIPSADEAGEELVLVETDDTIGVTLRGKPVLEYVKTARPVPEGIEDHFSRSGYIHPVFSPTGEEVTGDYPADHAHQHALFFAWTKSRFDGRETDFWNQAKQSAGVEFRDVVDIRRSPERVSFSVRHAFYVGSGDQRADALHETWTVTVHRTPEDYFLFDIESVQKCATEKPLLLAEYHYGGMAVRGNVEWLKEKGEDNLQPGDLRFITSEGKNRPEGNHTRPNWVAMTGQLQGQEVSFVVFGSPRNFRAPQHVRLHPTKPYFCFAPSVAGSFEIRPGQEYVSRYRYLVTSDVPEEPLIQRLWKQYEELEAP